jgi:hypothetical protein
MRWRKLAEKVGLQEQLTDLNETGIPSRVIGPTPSTFFGADCVDVILLDSSILLSLVSLFKSRFMELTESQRREERKKGFEVIILKTEIDGFCGRRHLKGSSREMTKLTPLSFWIA